MRARLLWFVALLVIVVFSVIVIAGVVNLEEVTGKRAHDGDTIFVHFDGDEQPVRYVSINTPGFKNSDCFAEEAKQRTEELIKRANLWLDLNPTKDGWEKDRNSLLGHVFLSPDRTQMSSVAVQLVATGYARLDVRDPIDDDIAIGEDFDVRYTHWIIPAQIGAATARDGWWGECDDYVDSDVIIAAIKQWSHDEIVYIVNRGDESIDLAAGWKLWDEAGKEGDERSTHRLDFSDYLIDECLLLPGGLLRVHSGRAAKDRRGQLTGCNELEMDFYWRGYRIWNQDSDEGYLYDPDGNLVYHYSYPLKWE